MDRLRIVDEIAAIGRGLVKLSEAHRKVSSGYLDLINQVQVATTRLQNLRDQLREAMPKPPGVTGSPVR